MGKRYVLLIVICSLLLSSCSFLTGGHIEKHNLTYEQYNNLFNSGLDRMINLPWGAQAIDWFFFGGFDTNYEFVQAEAKLSRKDLYAIVLECPFMDITEPTFVENVDYSIDQFNKIFGPLKEVPSWWIGNNAMSGFDVNILKFGNDNKYGNDEGYGYGCWAFYNSKEGIVKIFRWSQQWLSDKQVKETFNIAAQPVKKP